MKDTKTKTCPYCYEEIKFEAKKCRFCRSNLTESLVSVTWSRNVPGRKWLGVASVLGLNSGIPVLAWRVIFIVLSLFHGLGLVAYLAIWLLTPFKEEGRAPLERIMKASKQAFQTIRTDENNTVNGME